MRAYRGKAGKRKGGWQGSRRPRVAHRHKRKVGGSQVGCDDQVVAAMDPDALFDGGKSRDSDVIDSTVGPADCQLTTSD